MDISTSLWIGVVRKEFSCFAWRRLKDRFISSWDNFSREKRLLVSSFYAGMTKNGFAPAWYCRSQTSSIYSECKNAFVTRIFSSWCLGQGQTHPEAKPCDANTKYSGKRERSCSSMFNIFAMTNKSMRNKMNVLLQVVEGYFVLWYTS